MSERLNIPGNETVDPIARNFLVPAFLLYLRYCISVSNLVNEICDQFLGTSNYPYFLACKHYAL